MRRWTIRILFALLVLVVGLLLSLRTDTVRTRLLAIAIAAVEDALDVRVSVGALRGPVLRTFVLEDVRMRSGGQTVLHAPRVELSYALVPLLGGRLRIDRLALDRPRVRLVRTADGWVLPGSRSPEEDDDESSTAVTLNGIEVRGGRIAVALLDAERPRRVAATALDLNGSARLGDTRTIDVRTLRFVPRGIALGAVEASAALDVAADGRVDVSRFALATPRSRLDASGTFAPGRRVDAQATLSPLAAADVRAFDPGVDLLADVRARARARGSWDAIGAVARLAADPGGDAHVTARIDAAAPRLRYDGRIRLDAIDPGAIVAGQVRTSLGGRLDVAGAVTAHRVRGRLAAPLGEATLAARVALDEPPAYAARAEYTIARLEDLVPSTWGWVAGTARVRGRGTAPADRRAVARMHVRGAMVHGLPIDRARLRAGVNGERLAVDRLRLVSREIGVDVQARSQAHLDDRTATTDATAVADLSAVGRYLGRPLSGTLTGTGTATGTLETLAVRAAADVRRPGYESYGAEQVSLKADLHDVTGPSAGGTVEVTGVKVRAGTRSPYAVRSTGEWRRHAGADRVDVVLAATAEDGTAQRTAAAIERTTDRTLVTLRELQLTPPEGATWRLVAPAVVRIDRAATIDDLTMAAGRQRASMRGRIALQEGSSDATVTLTDVELGPVCATTGGPQCGGRVSARAAVTGTPAAPIVALTLAGRALTVGDVAYGDLDARGDYATRHLKLGATLQHVEAGALRAQGEVPVDLAWAGPRADVAGAPLSLALTADQLDLTFIKAAAPRTVEDAAGRLALDFTVTGTRADPRVRGNAVLIGGRLKLAATGIAYESIRGHVAADGTRISVRELHAEADGGTADLTGGMDLTGAWPLDLQLRLRKFFAVRQAAYEAAVSGDVAIAGTRAAPAVTGTVVVDEAEVRPAGLPASEPKVPDDPTIVVVGGPAVPVQAEPPPAEPIGESARVAVKIEIERNAWIRRSDADIEIGGTLEVTKEPHQPPRLVGEIRLLRGWYQFQGRRLTLEPGSRIVFTGATPPQPAFDITAVYETPEYRIEVHLTGSADKPSLDFSSTPPLEKADILAVLLFGKPVQSLGRGESDALQQQAIGLAAGYAIPGLRSSMMNAFGLETFDVEMPEGTTPGKVSAGRYVAEDVFVSLGQEFGRRAAQIVGVEYYLGRNISVRASTTTRGDSALDLLWRYRY